MPSSVFAATITASVARLVALAAIAAALAACGATPAIEAAAPPNDDAPSLAAVPTVPASAPVRPYRLAWTSAEDTARRQIAIAPWGDVLVERYGMLRLLARHDGSVLEQGHGSRDTLALRFVGDHRALLVTEQGRLMEVKFPGMVLRTVHRLPARDHGRQLSAAAIGADLVATGSRDGMLSVLDVDSFAQRFEAQVGGEVEQIALSPSGGRLAVTLRGGELHVYDIKARQRLLRSERLGALSFSADGRELFGRSDDGPLVISVATGKNLREYPNGERTSMSCLVRPGLTASASSDGLRLYASQAGEPQLLPLPQDAHTMASVDVSRDGAVICGAGWGGRVVCVSQQRLTATGYQPAPPLVGEPWAEGARGVDGK